MHTHIYAQTHLILYIYACSKHNQSSMQPGGTNPPAVSMCVREAGSRRKTLINTKSHYMRVLVSLFVRASSVTCPWILLMLIESTFESLMNILLKIRNSESYLI